MDYFLGIRRLLVEAEDIKREDRRAREAQPVFKPSETKGSSPPRRQTTAFGASKGETFGQVKKSTTAKPAGR